MELLLNDYTKCTIEQVKEDIIYQYCVDKTELDKYKILIALVNEHDYEEDSYFLLMEKSTGKFYQNFASYCSCYGFENQFVPEEVELEYLLSKHADFGYSVSDNDLKRIQSELLVLVRWFKLDNLLKNDG